MNSMEEGEGEVSIARGKKHEFIQLVKFGAHVIH